VYRTVGLCFSEIRCRIRPSTDYDELAIEVESKERNSKDQGNQCGGVKEQSDKKNMLNKNR